MAQTCSLRRPLAALLFAFLASGGVAQTLTISPGTTVPAGTDVQLGYHDPAAANTTIVITVSGGTPPSSVSMSVALDATGKGSGQWKAPADWRKGFVSAPGCPQQIITITPSLAIGS
jgi:hypothetical protein